MDLIRLGLVPYEDALELQQTLQKKRQLDLIDDTILLLQHPPVLTLGTRGKTENIFCTEEELCEAGITVFNINRGGDVTYHGPGQLIIYPIIKLYGRSGGIREFIKSIEQAVINWLSEKHQIESHSGQDKMTGVWVGEAKIMAVGLSVNQGVTMHGFALNLNTDLKPFALINPCGLNKPVTSLHILTERPIDFSSSEIEIGSRIAEMLGEESVWQDLGNISER